MIPMLKDYLTVREEKDMTSGLPGTLGTSGDKLGLKNVQKCSEISNNVLSCLITLLQVLDKHCNRAMLEDEVIPPIACFVHLQWEACL